MSLQSFAPSGNTVLIVATSSTGVAATQMASTPGVSHVLRVSVPSTSGVGVPVYLAFGSSSVAASVPTTAGSAGIPVMAGVRAAMFTVSPSTANNWVSAVTSAGSVNLYITPGSFGH
jgi:hypothetical protein